MAMDWGKRRKILYLAGALAVFVLAAGSIFYFGRPEPTCSDKKQNQGEEGADCGGPCLPCLDKSKDLVVYWSVPIKVSEGKYDLAALVENPNIYAGIEDIAYQFKIYDSKNILIAVKENSTFANPNEQFVIFEPNVDVGQRVPTKAFLEFSKNFKWKYVNKERPSLSIVSKDFSNTPTPRLTASIKNGSLFEIKNIYLSAVVFNRESNTVGASATKVSSLLGDSSKQVVFTWPVSFPDEFSSTKIFWRTNLTAGQE